MKPFKDWRLYSQLFVTGILPVLFAVIIIGAAFYGGLFELKNDAISAQTVIQNIRTNLVFYTSELREHLIGHMAGEPDDRILSDLAALEKILLKQMGLYGRIAEEREAASGESLAEMKQILNRLNQISTEMEQPPIHAAKVNQEIDRLESDILKVFESATALAEAEIESEMMILSGLVAGASIAALVFSYLFVGRLSRMIVNQILVLKSASERFGRGELSRRAVIDASNEMGKLCSAFNKMADDLQQAMGSLKHEVGLRKASEEELLQSHAKLEHRVKERSEELKQTYQQLAHAGRLTALGEMATGIAHEIRQPLAIIDLANRSLTHFFDKKYTDPERARSATASIAEQIQRADRIIDNMRAFARTDTADFRCIDLREPVAIAASFFKEQCKLHNISLETDWDPSLPAVKADPQKIEQIVVNLISNARHAVQPNPGQGGKKEAALIRIRLYPNNDNDACLEITDNGTGMSDAVKEKCLEPFFTTKEVGQGTGLGLSIVYNIVRELKGRIEIESQMDIGTSFRIIIPSKEGSGGHQETIARC